LGAVSRYVPARAWGGAPRPPAADALAATYAAAAAGRLSPTDVSTIRTFQASGLLDLTAYVVGDDLGGSILLLVCIPLLSLTVGAIGASRPRRRPVA